MQESSDQKMTDHLFVLQKCNSEMLEGNTETFVHKLRHPLNQELRLRTLSLVSLVRASIKLEYRTLEIVIQKSFKLRTYLLKMTVLIAMKDTDNLFLQLKILVTS